MYVEAILGLGSSSQVMIAKKTKITHPDFGLGLFGPRNIENEDIKGY